jgi:hypothetical protein
MIGKNSKPNFHLITEMQELAPLAISRIFCHALVPDSHLNNIKEYSLQSVVEMLWTSAPVMMVFNTPACSHLLSIEQNSDVLVYNGTSHNNFVVNKL